jgi:1-acyl-sn-glycerol-3-phosphate acyltransferase
MSNLPEVGPHRKSVLRFWVHVIRVVTWLVFLVLGPIKVRGRYRVPKKGGVLILANHLADLDPPALQVGCPRPIHFMAKSELFEMPVLGGILRLVNAFPVKRGEPDRTALKHAAALLKAGEAVCIFPEGQLSETGELQELKPGVALIVRMAGVPVICCGITNTNRVMPYGSFVLRPTFRRTLLEWGEERTFAKDASADEIMAWAEGQLRMLTGQEVETMVAVTY